MSDYLWHKISDSERKSIEEEAKKIMFHFSKSLEKVPKVKESFVDRPDDRREEGIEDRKGNDFRKFLFENAPKSKGDFIIAEKGEWVK